MRPKAIILFERFFLAMIVVNLINGFANFDRTLGQIKASPEAAAMFGSGFLIATIAIAALINLLLWYFVARRGSVIAKWIVVVFFGIVLLTFVASLGALKLPLALITISALILQALAVYMLFRPDAVAWLRGERADTPDTFA